MAPNGPAARPNGFEPVLGIPKEPQDTRKSLPGRPMDAKEALTVQKIRLQKPLPAKIDVEYDFEYFLVEF